MTAEQTTEYLKGLARESIKRAKSEPAHLLLCAEMRPGVVTLALYQSFGNRLEWLDTGDKIDSLLFDFWYAAEPDKLWRGILLEINEGSFTATFDYPEGPYPIDWDALDEEDGDGVFEAIQQRMMAAVRQRFGDKPIIYPTPEELAEQQLRERAARGYDFDLEPPSSD